MRNGEFNVNEASFFVLLCKALSSFLIFGVLLWVCRYLATLIRCCTFRNCFITARVLWIPKYCTHITHQSADSNHRSASAGRCCLGSAVSRRVCDSLSDPSPFYIYNLQCTPPQPHSPHGPQLVTGMVRSSEH